MCVCVCVCVCACVRACVCVCGIYYDVWNYFCTAEREETPPTPVIAIATTTTGRTDTHTHTHTLLYIGTSEDSAMSAQSPPLHQSNVSPLQTYMLCTRIYTECNSPSGCIGGSDESGATIHRGYCRNTSHNRATARYNIYMYMYM